MALKTFGSTSTTVLRALQWSFVGGATQAADNATLNFALRTPNSGSLGPINPQQPGGPWLTGDGLLHLPAGRGIIKLQRGDWVVFDPASGWPFVIANLATTIAGTDWAHS